MSNQFFTTAGSSSWNCDESGTYLVECYGGGQSGGNAANNTNAGTGGGYASKQVSLTASTSYNYTVGSGGTAGTTRVNGGDTNWNSNEVLAPGGGTGTSAVGTTTRTGGAGGARFDVEGQWAGGGGGGAAGSTGNGSAGGSGGGGGNGGAGGGGDAGAGGNGTGIEPPRSSSGGSAYGGGGGQSSTGLGGAGYRGAIRLTFLAAAGHPAVRRVARVPIGAEGVIIF